MKCPKCGAWNAAYLPKCTQCGAPLPQKEDGPAAWEESLYKKKPSLEVTTFDEKEELSASEQKPQSDDAGFDPEELNRADLTDELEDLKKQQRELSYKLKNTQNAEHYQKYRAELDKVNERLDEIYDNQKRAAKGSADNINEPEVKQSGSPDDLPPGDGTGADIREPRSFDDLKADDNLAKITTSTEKKADGSFKAKVDKAWQSTKRMFIDNFAAFEDIGRTLRKVDQAKGDSFMAAINALRLTRNKAGAMLKEGRINRFGKADKSLSQIFDSKEYGNLLKDKAKYEDFQYYLYHKHNIDRAREGKNVFGDVSSEESARIASELEAKYGQEFIDRLSDEKEQYIDELYEESYQQKRMYPYLDEDFSVMVMQISDDLTVVSVDFPTRDFAPGCAQRAYLAWNKADNAGRYFTTDLTREKTIELIEIGADHSRISHGEAPVEGAELQTIIDLISDGEKLN